MRKAKSNSAPVVSLVSLGCAKNTVDSERLLGGLLSDGWLLAEDPAEADVCLVNTCGFIESAREETRQTLAALADGRRAGRPRRIVALGCMVERATTAPETSGVLADADARVGFADYARLPALCRALLRADEPAAPIEASTVSAPPTEFYRLPRLLTGSPHVASLKISEGCTNRCAFCSIPLIRGKQISRPVHDLLLEARQLAEAGAKEICLIAQDTTSYGRDLPDGMGLADLIRRLSATLAPTLWIRLMYAHPRRLTDDLVRVLRDTPQICPYLDLPLQHLSDPMLRAMGRGMTQAQTLRRLDRIRDLWPESVWRTTWIVGFPGETDSDFETLFSFVREGRFLHAGVFPYSPEPGTRAARLPGAADPRVAQQRAARLMREQRAVSRRLLRKWIGRDVEVMADERNDRDSWRARTRWQAPEVDGSVLLETHSRRLQPGDVRSVRITRSRTYDLIAKLD